MAREEQIRKEAHRVSYNGDEFSSFILGAEWADENPKEGLVSLDKVCEYLESKLKSRIGYYSAYNFANDFRKAMEE